MRKVLSLWGKVLEKVQIAPLKPEHERGLGVAGRGVLKIRVSGLIQNTAIGHEFESESGHRATALLPEFGGSHDIGIDGHDTTVIIKTDDPCLLDAVSIGDDVTVELVGPVHARGKTPEPNVGWKRVSPLNMPEGFSPIDMAKLIEEERPRLQKELKSARAEKKADKK